MKKRMKEKKMEKCGKQTTHAENVNRKSEQSKGESAKKEVERENRNQQQFLYRFLFSFVLNDFQKDTNRWLPH